MHPFLNLRILKFLPIHLRRTSHFASELPVEVGKVAETIVVRDFGHTLRRTAQRLAGGFDPKYSTAPSPKVCLKQLIK